MVRLVGLKINNSTRMCRFSVVTKEEFVLFQTNEMTKKMAILLSFSYVNLRLSPLFKKLNKLLTCSTPYGPPADMRYPVEEFHASAPT